MTGADQFWLLFVALLIRNHTILVFIYSPVRRMHASGSDMRNEISEVEMPYKDRDDSKRHNHPEENHFLATSHLVRRMT